MADALDDGSDIRTALAASAARWAAEAKAHRDGNPSAPLAQASWRAIADLGWLGIMAPDHLGGVGLGLGDLAVVAQAIGAANLHDPVSTVAGVAVPLLAAATAGSRAAENLLAGAIAGDRIIVLAHAEPRGGYDRTFVETTLSSAGERRRLIGRKSAVEGGGEADIVLVSARRPDGALALVAVPATTPGLVLNAYRALDGRQLVDLAFDLDVPEGAELVLPDATTAIDQALDRGALLAMAEAVGAMGVLFDDTMAHLRTRQQFGQPLARFQALQHRAVDMSIALEEARAVVEAAGDAAEPDAFARAVAVAKVVGSRSARLVAREAVQMHGGIGITEDLKVSHLFRRLVAAENQYGDDDFYIDRFETLSQATGHAGPQAAAHGRTTA
jgi:alkylation response protein AidB-like acyl-CoA dehydrogenase